MLHIKCVGKTVYRRARDNGLTCTIVGYSRTLALQHTAWKSKENSVNMSLVHEWVGTGCTVVHKLGELPQGNTVEPPIAARDGRLAVTRPPTGPGGHQLGREHTHAHSHCHQSINQSIIRFVLRHSTTVLMAQDNVITTGKKDVSTTAITATSGLDIATTTNRRVTRRSRLGTRLSAVSRADRTLRTYV